MRRLAHRFAHMLACPRCGTLVETLESSGYDVFDPALGETEDRWYPRPVAVRRFGDGEPVQIGMPGAERFSAATGTRGAYGQEAVSSVSGVVLVCTHYCPRCDAVMPREVCRRFTGDVPESAYYEEISA